MSLPESAIREEDGVRMKGVVEALLFASDTPLSAARIREVIGEITDGEVHEIVESLREEYRESGRSFDVYTLEGGFQVLSRPDYADWVEQLFVERRKAKLSRASLETLAIIAYKQPIVKTEIEMIRGVGADGVIRTLMERNLVTITGRAEGVGRPLLYGTTQQFLNYFGLNELSDLPKMEEIREILRGEASESSA